MGIGNTSRDLEPLLSADSASLLTVTGGMRRGVSASQGLAQTIRSRDQDVVAGSPVEGVPALVAGQHVVAVPAEEGVAAHWDSINDLSRPQQLKSGYDIVGILKRKVPYLQYENETP